VQVIEKSYRSSHRPGRLAGAEHDEISAGCRHSRLSGFGRELFSEWRQSNTPRLGAALAYYSVFAIAPLFLLTLGIAGVWFGQDSARQEMFGQVQQLVGTEGGKAIESVVTAAANQPKTGAWAAFVAGAALAVAATGVFVELQNALNTIWKVKPITQHGLGGFIHFVKARLISFAMLLGVGFLLLISLVLSASLAATGSFLGGFMGAQHLLWAATNFMISLGVISILFAMILKVLPDVNIAWRDVWIGGVLTALLFNLGKFLLGFYLGRSSIASAYGATGSLVIILLWVYYSAQILFFGAQFTKVYTRRFGSHSGHGHKAEPARHHGNSAKSISRI
jgi:membrane protein